MKRVLAALPVLLALFAAGTLEAQQQFPTLERGLQPEKLYHFAGIDNVNIFNGNLTIVLPIGPSQTVDGGLNYQLTLSYNSNLWDWAQVSGPSGGGSHSIARPNSRSNAGFGWIIGYGDYIPTTDPDNSSFTDVFSSPDGGDHRFDKSYDHEPGYSYTTDGSNLRLRKLLVPTDTIAFINFPDGSVSRHEKGQNNHWDLKEIAAPRGDKRVTFTKLASRPAQCRSTSDSWTRVSDGTRNHYLCFETYDMDGEDWHFIDTVVIDGVQNQSSTYTFVYDTFNTGLVEGESRLSELRTYHRITVLKEIRLPDQSSYRFEHLPDRVPNQVLSWPDLLSMTLPTGGKIDYAYYAQYDVPPMAICTRGYDNSEPYRRFGIPPGVVAVRTVKPAPVAQAIPQEFVWKYSWKVNWNPKGTQCMGPGGPNLVDHAMPDELTASVTGPDGSRVDTHYSVWPGDMIDDSARGFKPLHYGFPYGVYDATQDRYLSTERYDCSGGECKKLRTTYVRHDIELRDKPIPSFPNVAMPIHRLASEKVFYNDDPANCVAGGAGSTCRSITTEKRDWDGYGHYREIETSHDFGSGGKRTVKTDWNKLGGVARVIEPGDPWSPDEYQNRTIEEDGKTTRREQACFDQVPGHYLQRFLKGRRALAGAAPGANDVITTSSLNENDYNVEYERIFGGDRTPLPDGAATAAELCSAIDALSTPDHEVKHTFQNGSVATSQVTGAPFLSLDLTIDRSGLPTASRDTAGVLTKFSYYSDGRIKRIEPTGGAVTEYTYSNAALTLNGVLASAAKAVATTNSSSGEIRQEYIYDSLGHLWREKEQMPDERWRLRETVYDGFSRKTRVSEWADFPTDAHELTFHPRYGTTFSGFDIFGRPSLVTGPDDSTVSFGYTGDRIKTRTSSVATSLTSESSFTTTEEYDGFGRLRTVIEPAGESSAGDPIAKDVTTNYGYDAAGRLTSVDITDENNIVQHRQFDYDGRGFLTKEEHRENGDTTYTYDARGSVWQRTNGGEMLEFTYDPAGRLTNVDTSTGTPLKVFQYAPENSGSNKQQGKLVAAIRHNYPPSGGQIDVTEAYEYGKPGGLMSKKSTLVESVNGSTRTTIQQFDMEVSDYDDLMMPETVKLPTCVYQGCSGTEKGIAQLTYRRSATYLADVEGFGSLTYHPSGMVETVKHATPQAATDKYTARFDMARPSKITFQGCTNTKPYFLPGFVRAKVDPNACGIQVSWPAATLCGGVSDIRYRVLRDGQQVQGASCLPSTTTKFLDRDAAKGSTYTYTIIAEGPNVEGGGGGTCQGGQTTSFNSKPFEFKSCDAETLLTAAKVRASVGKEARFEATLSSANGPLVDEELVFSLFGTEIGRARTNALGVAAVLHEVDIDPGEYPGQITVVYAGNLFSGKTVTADLSATCDSASYSVKPVVLNVVPAGGIFPILVTTSSRCSWQAKPFSFGFLSGRVTPTDRKNGVGTYEIDVPVLDPGSSDRSTYVRTHFDFSFRDVIVEQGSDCTYRFSPDVAYIQYKNDLTSTIEVSTSPGCSWSVTSNESWLRLDPAHRSGTGSGYIAFSAEQNNGRQRMALLSLNDGVETAKVNQFAPPPVVCPTMVTNLEGGGSVSNGQNISLRVHVDGTYLKYTWWANGRKIQECEEDRCAALTLFPGQDGYPPVGQSSTFVVTAENSCDGVVSNAVTFSNHGGSCKVPTIGDSTFGTNQWPGDRYSSRPGFTVRLFARIDPWPFSGSDLKLQWYSGRAGDRDNPVSDADGGKTDEIKVDPRHTTFYWLEATVPCGSQISRNAAVIITPPPRVRRRAVKKDFTGDDIADLLWQNKATGQNEVWEMGGTNHTSTIAIPSSSAGSKLQSVGDIDDDGRADLLFRNQTTGENEVWLMNRTNFRGALPLETRDDTRWVIGAVADLDNDYSEDIIWHNAATGENEIWFQTGTEHEGTWALPSNPSAGWGLHGTEDFNGDLSPDLFFHDRITGQNAIWIMNDAERWLDVGTTSDSPSGSPVRRVTATIETLSSMPDTNWMPALVADLTLDGLPDIVWRNVVTGENAVWEMSGTKVTKTIALETRADVNWQIGGGGSTNADPIGGGGPTPGTPTSIAVVADPALAGTATAVTATLTAGSTPVASRQLVFTLSGVEKARLLTGSDGTATAAINVNGLAAGTHPNAIAVRFEGDTNYGSSTASTNLVITAAPIAISWSNPAPIMYGTPLGAAQLNATADVPGTFVYSPPAGTILDAGYRTLSLTFTPTDTTLAPITRTALILVNKAPSSVTWAKPAEIAYGTPLSELQLNATSTLAGEFTYDPEPGAVLPVGAGQTLRVTFQPDSANYDASSTTTTIDVTKGRQVIFWDDPAPISSSVPLGPAQLNAKVVASGIAPAGEMTYNPPAGTILGVGVHELRVSVAATENYEAAEGSVDIVVTQTATSVQWATPVPIAYGTPLSATQLNATASMPGTYAYTPPAGTILSGGQRQLYVLFTPTDTRYEPASASVTIQVTKTTQTITWNKPASIVYPAKLSAVQLNATVQASGPGEAGILSYAPDYHTILPAGLGQTLTVTAQATENYEVATATVQIDVLKANPVITWPQPAPIVYKTLLGAQQLNATASVPGTFQYTPAAGTLLEAGLQTLTVEFTPADTSNYNVVSSNVAIEVLKATPVITWSQPAPIIYKTLLGSAQLNATADVAGTFEYTPPAGTLLEAGTHTLTARLTPADTRNYNGATATTTIEVQRATPVITWPAPAGIVYGTPLGADQLNATADVPGAFVYTPPSGTILDAGASQTLAVHFTPADTHNYNDADASTTLDVAKAKQTIVWAAPASIVYGTPLSPTQLNARVDVVGPSPAGAVTYTPAAGTVLDAGTHTLTVDVAETPNYEPATASVTLAVTRAPLSLVVDAKAKPYGAPLPALTGVLTGVVNDDPITASYATTATQQSPVAVYPITGTLNDPSGRLFNYDVTITPSTLTVLPVPLQIAANAAAKQYSDPLPQLTATFTGFVLGETPAVLSGVLSITTTATPLSPVGTYPMHIGGLTSGNYVITYVQGVLTVTPEDARVLITSPVLISAAASGPTSITLSATVRDISATDDAAGDVDPGDIRTATLSFVDRATNQVLCSGPIGLLGASDQRIGVASCTFSRDFGATLPASLVAGARIAGNYTRDAAADDVTITVAAATADAITGAGTINVLTAAGARAPSVGSDAKFQLNLQYDKNGAVQGKLTLTFTGSVDGAARQYELTASTIGSLAIQRTASGGIAVITGAATLRDVTKPSSPAIIFEGARMVITATDAGEPSPNDALSVTVLNDQGGLWIATGWNGLKPVEQTLRNGNLAVHYSKK